MIKRTLCFSMPTMLSLQNKQLVVKLIGTEIAGGSDGTAQAVSKTIPIEDLGVVLLDHPQITITHGVMAALLENNCAIITCNAAHMPMGLMLPLEGNSIQSERYTDQINASLPLKKQLWQQTVACKIRNQAEVLYQLRKTEVQNMRVWVNQVKSGDSENLEARAAAYYWKNMFPDIPDFIRDRDGIYPNNLLNYAYAILRAVIARALVSSGMLPTLGIHHHNRYNAYCLADDIMEPYRPYIDRLVVQVMKKYPFSKDLDTSLKKELLIIPALDVTIDGQRRPLMVAASQTSASLYKCFSGELRKITYPILE